MPKFVYHVALGEGRRKTFDDLCNKLVDALNNPHGAVSEIVQQGLSEAVQLGRWEGEDAFRPSLRDQFAMHASATFDTSVVEAESRYKYADAMLVARGKVNGS